VVFVPLDSAAFANWLKGVSGVSVTHFGISLAALGTLLAVSSLAFGENRRVKSGV